MIAILACVCVASWQDAREEPEAFDPRYPTWEVGLIAASVPSPPGGNWLGSPSFLTDPATFRSAGSTQEGRAQVSVYDDWEQNDVRLRLTASGATVQFLHSSDVIIGSLTDVAGNVCLVTNGRAVAAEFELYAIYESYFIMSIFGRVELTGGPDLARLLLERSKDAGAKTFDRFVHSSHQSSGHLDDIGRHQGVWTVRDAQQGRMEISWRDGVPHGSVLGWDAQGRLRSLENYRDGFEDGESRNWTEDGALWLVESYSSGRHHGPRLRFYPSGCKEYEERFENGRAVGTIPHWSEDGKLLDEEKNEGGFTRRQSADHERLLAAVSALHTRPTPH